MGYHHYEPEPEHTFHSWKNYSRKIPQNPIPTFKFPTQPTPPETTFIPETSTTVPETTTAMENITKLIKDIITPFTSGTDGKMTESSFITSTTENNIINGTFTDIVGLTPNNTLIESSTSNSSVVFDIMEATTSSSITDVMQNGSMPIIPAQNGTDLMGNDGTILTTVTELASSTAENTVSILSSTTEKAITFATETVKKISTSTEMNNHDHDHMHYHFGMGSQRLLYVILLIIIAILILIGVILLLIYIRYRKNSSRALHNYYEVSPMKERTPSDNGQEQHKQGPAELYMHYHC